MRYFPSEATGRRSERGAAIVEFAIILPLLVMLIMGLVSAGIAYNHQIALTHAAREAGRYAATLPVTNFVADPVPMESWLRDVAARAVEDATGSLDPATAPGWEICVAYVHPDGTLATDSTMGRTENAGGESFAAASCFGDTRPTDERRVQVRVVRETKFNVVFFSPTLTIDSEAVNRFEAGFGF